MQEEIHIVRVENGWVVESGYGPSHGFRGKQFVAGSIAQLTGVVVDLAEKQVAKQERADA